MEVATANGGAPSPALKDAPAVSISQVFCLGWNICRLYMSGAAPARKHWHEAPERLPSPGRFSEAERSLIRLGQVKAAIDDLDSSLTPDGGDESLHSVVGGHIAQLDPGDDGSAGCAYPRASICEAHVALAHALSCSDARLAKAYHLGVSLATTCYSPDGPESLKQEFERHRIAQLGEWLADLTSLFPDHASRAVRISCGTWRRWVNDPQVSVAEAGEAGEEDPGAIKRARARATGKMRALDWEQEWIEVRRSLARQGEVWRALLSDEKPGTAMLELRDYVAAGARALRNGVGLLKRLWPALLLALALLALGMALLVNFESTGAKIAGLVTVAGSIGITWKGLLGGVGTVMAKLQKPIWGAALDEEIAHAITTLPAGARPTAVEARDAAPASGPQPSVLALPAEVAEKPEWAA